MSVRGPSSRCLGGVLVPILLATFARMAAAAPPPPMTPFLTPTANSDPTGIVAGADGNLWVAEAFGNRIARVTPAGVITEFPLPMVNSSPFLVAGGPDGNVWFTEN